MSIADQIELPNLIWPLVAHFNNEHTWNSFAMRILHIRHFILKLKKTLGMIYLASFPPTSPFYRWGGLEMLDDLIKVKSWLMVKSLTIESRVLDFHVIMIVPLEKTNMQICKNTDKEKLNYCINLVAFWILWVKEFSAQYLNILAQSIWNSLCQNYWLQFSQT